jgi:hypothetical protein
MIEYVNGMGDYWVRLVEQMIPATTIWTTGVKMENSIFHRQKFVWRRQRGCELIPINSSVVGGKFTGSIFQKDCSFQSVICPLYPNQSKELGGFTNVLKYVVDEWIKNNGNNNCDLTTINSDWFIDLNVNGFTFQYPFFTGIGYYNYKGQSCLPATPCLSTWTESLNFALSQLNTLGYDYRYETINNVITDISDSNAVNIRIWNTNCSETPLNEEITINIGINFTISCTN